MTHRNLQYHFGNFIRLWAKVGIGFSIYELVKKLQQLPSEVFVKFRFISSLAKSKTKFSKPILTFVHRRVSFPKWYCRFLWVISCRRGQVLKFDLSGRKKNCLRTSKSWHLNFPRPQTRVRRGSQNQNQSPSLFCSFSYFSFSKIK